MKTLMKKSVFIVCIIVVLLSVCAICLSKKRRNNHNDSDYVKQNIETIIKIQYRRADSAGLKDISTMDFIDNLTEDFYKGFHFYAIDEKFMETCRETDDGNLMISVRVDDWRGSYIQVFTLIKDGNNKYLISKLQYDI